MIKTEVYKVLPGGKTLVRTYSTTGRMILREGLMYSEAIDDASFGYAYEETNVPAEGEDSMAAEEDYLRALERLGVSND
ncbi:MAG: hypothetical protein IKT58_04805 [Oscillospiraceae bacterium]|nr:hypothetical protein [Oscillospiraceae bacterium]